MLHAECRCLDKVNCCRGFETVQKRSQVQVPALVLHGIRLKQDFSFFILFFLLGVCVLLQDLLHKALSIRLI